MITIDMVYQLSFLIQSLQIKEPFGIVLNEILFEIDESFLQIIDFKQIIIQNCKAYMYLG